MISFRLRLCVQKTDVLGHHWLDNARGREVLSFVSGGHFMKDTIRRLTDPVRDCLVCAEDVLEAR